MKAIFSRLIAVFKTKDDVEEVDIWKYNPYES